MSTAPAKPRPISTGTVGLNAGEFLPLAEFCRRLGLTKSAWLALRASGAPFTTLGKRCFVDADMFVAWTRAAAEGKACARP